MTKPKPEFKSDSSMGRVMKNGGFVGLRFALYTLSGIVFIPYLYKKFGGSTYGLIALAGFLTQYVGIISKCIGNSVARFLNISLNQNNWEEASQIFSTAMVANIGFILVQIPIFALGVWQLDFLIDFPPEIASEFRFLVCCNIGVFFIAMITGVMRTPIQAANRLDLGATLQMGLLLLRIVLLFILIETLGAKLWFIGVVDLGLAVVNGVVVYTIYRKLAKHLVFKWKYVTRKWVRPVIGMAVWSMISSLGGYMLLRSDVWMVNRFVSKEMAGVYAVLLVWPNFMKQISKQFASLLMPVYLIDHAKGDNERVARVSLSSAKILGCIVGFGTGILLVGAELLLKLWLGPESVEHVNLFRVMVGFMTFIIGEAVLWQIYVTINKVHYTGIVSLLAGGANIVLSLLLIYLGYGVMGVAVSSVICMLFSSALAIPVGVCREFNVPYRTLLGNYLSAAIVMGLSALATAAGLVLMDRSVLLALLVFMLVLAIGAFPALRLVLTPTERELFLRLGQRIRSRIGGMGTAVRNKE